MTETLGPPPVNGSAADVLAVTAIIRSAGQLQAAVRAPLRRLTMRAGRATLDVEWAAAPAHAEPARTLRPADGPDRARPPGPHLHAADPAELTVNAPTVGTFRHAPAPDADPFVAPGDVIEPGQQIGVVEVMQHLNPVRVSARCRVTQILVPDATFVEYGQPLLAASPLEP